MLEKSAYQRLFSIAVRKFVRQGTGKLSNGSCSDSASNGVSRCPPPRSAIVLKKVFNQIVSLKLHSGCNIMNIGSRLFCRLPHQWLTIRAWLLFLSKNFPNSPPPLQVGFWYALVRKFCDSHDVSVMLQLGSVVAPRKVIDTCLFGSSPKHNSQSGDDPIVATSSRKRKALMLQIENVSGDTIDFLFDSLDSSSPVSCYSMHVRIVVLSLDVWQNNGSRKFAS